MDNSARNIKYFLYFLNFSIIVCSIGILAAGSIVLLCEHKGITNFIDFSIGNFAIHVGVLVFAVAIFGFYITFKEDTDKLHVYSYILVILVIFQIGLGIAAFATTKDNFKSEHAAKEMVDRVFQEFIGYPKDYKKKIIDEIQKYFECCGVDSSEIWLTYFGEIPYSCYKDEGYTEVFEDGCAKSYQDKMTMNIKVVGGFSLGFALFELLGAVLICLIRKR